MQLIESYTVPSGGVSSIVFDEIPATFTDLCVLLSGRTTAANVQTNIFLTFNGSTSDFSERLLFGDGSSTGSNTGPSTASIRFLYGSGASSTASTFSNSSIYIPNYTAAANKSVSIDSVTENNATAAFQNITAGLWANTDPITSITFAPESSNFVQYSSASLFGVLAGSDGIVAVS
jgi:hypothetical protein